MELGNFLKRAVVIPAVAATAVLAAAMWPSASVSATTGDVIADAPQPAVTLSQNSSYVSNPYFGMLHVETTNNTVACASSDSQNRLVVTAVGTGSATVSFWYKTSAGSAWASTTMPVTVTAEASSQTASVNAGSAGIVFAQPSALLAAGGSYTPQNIRLDGYSVQTSSLLWVSYNDSVATVDKSTGTVSAIGKGTVSIFAVDPSTKYCGSYTVTVS